ncbi:TOBE domain-containing protein [Solimonas flava]|uniref:TOBE domain-containing protein n=1 Tax=Solimonas flava TaxID=415849 RepID=UPI00040CA8D0|nr:TOBE domain-containing protein [Solimonas flava]
MTKRRSAPTFQAEPGLQFGAGLAANGTRIALLERIGETGSITAAAKAVGLSYKAAWDAIAAMNNLADRPLVERSAGGRGGGGTRLTARGQELVQSFRRMEAQHRRFIESLNETGAQDGDDWRVLGRLAMQTSARNQFAGRVTRRTRGVVNDEIELRLSGGETLVATVTRESSETLGLKRGAEAVALVKASSVIVAVDDGVPLRLSARNQLRGTIEAVHKGAVNSEVLIALAGGNTVAAIITNGSAEALGLAVGTPALALFKSSSVILAVAP